MMDDNWGKKTQTGFLERAPQPGEFQASGESAAPKVLLARAGQFDAVLPDVEWQVKSNLDVFACVTFSALNCIETVFAFLLANDGLSEKAKTFLRENGYIAPSGKVNFSDRFTAKMSGTTKNGNYLTNVGESARNDGLVPEADWPFIDRVPGQTDDEYWNAYYAEIPEEVKAKGKRFREVFRTWYEWVLVGNGDAAVTPLLDALPYGPVQIAAPICSPWDGSAVVKRCGSTRAQHATMIYGYERFKDWKDFDHYKASQKLLTWNYYMPYGLQYFVEEIGAPARFFVNLMYGDVGDEVRRMQSAMQRFGYMKQGVFGPFGPQTAAAVLAFQLHEKVDDEKTLREQAGKNFGPRTRAALNRLLQTA